MSAFWDRLRGRRVSGIVALGPRSMALGLEAKPRDYLWIHLERKEARVALAPELPIPPDPRGSPFGALERPIRGSVVVAAEEGERGAAALGLAPEPGATPTYELALEASGTKANLVLRAVAEGAVLWALHREEAGGATEAGTPPGPLPGSPAAPPRTFHPPRITIAEDEPAREALGEAIGRDFRADFDRHVHHALHAAERTLTRRVEGLLADRERTRDRLLDRLRAEALLARYAEIPRGASRVELPNPYADSPGAVLEIELDPALSPQENAARLFRRAKRGERGEEMIEERLARSRKSLMTLSELRRVLTSRPPKEALSELSGFLDGADLPYLSARGDQRRDRPNRRPAAAPRAGRPGHRSPGARESIRPRTFVSSDGWEIWVGRSNTENDLITHRLSNPHDLWFHVVGVPGSHVILRRPSRNAIPKHRTLEEAASVAAYYSKARKLTRVPVIFTERKFVSKPRRGKPGQAICTRERELLVRPKLPEGGSGATDSDD